MKSLKLVFFFLATLLLSSCKPDDPVPPNGDVWVSFSVLDKSTKEDLLDPKSDNPKAIDFATVQPFFFKGGKSGFVKGNNEVTNLSVTLEHRQDENSPNHRYYTVEFFSMNYDASPEKEGAIVHGITLFKWNETDIDTIKTEAEHVHFRLMKMRKIWVNSKLVWPRPETGDDRTDDETRAYFVLYK